MQKMKTRDDRIETKDKDILNINRQDNICNNVRNEKHVRFDAMQQYLDITKKYNTKNMCGNDFQQDPGYFVKNILKNESQEKNFCRIRCDYDCQLRDYSNNNQINTIQQRNLNYETRYRDNMLKRIYNHDYKSSDVNKYNVNHEHIWEDPFATNSSKNFIQRNQNFNFVSDQNNLNYLKKDQNKTNKMFFNKMFWQKYNPFNFNNGEKAKHVHCKKNVDDNEANSFNEIYLKNYRIISDLGEGTYGRVKLAYNIIEEREVALKFICKSLLTKKRQLQRVKNEVLIMSILNHPNICKMYRAIETNEDFILEMEYVRGVELYKYIKNKKRLSLREAKHVFVQLMRGIEYLHSNNIIHRDLKPENMIISKDGTLKIVDFGFATTFEFDKEIYSYCGSPYYIPPEMVMARPYEGPEVDIWSMGIILYAMVHGSLPFNGKNLDILYAKIIKGEFQMDMKLPESLRNLLERMLKKCKEKRLTIYGVIESEWIDQKTKYITPTAVQYIDHSIYNKLLDFHFDKKTLAMNIKRKQMPEAKFYKLIQTKMQKEKNYKCNIIFSESRFYQELKNIEVAKQIANSQVHPSCCTKKPIKKQYNETVYFHKLLVINKLTDYFLRKGFKFTETKNGLQVLIVRKESLLLDIEIDKVDEEKSIVRYYLNVGSEKLFDRVVEAMMDLNY